MKSAANGSNWVKRVRNAASAGVNCESAAAGKGRKKPRGGTVQASLEGGHFYVCGDGQAMAKDVHTALVNATMHAKKVSSDAAEAMLSKLSEEGRYCREIWN